MSYTEEELNSLTDEEREALLEAGEDDTTTTLEDSLNMEASDGEKDEEADKGGKDQDDDKDEPQDAGATDAGDDNAGPDNDASTDQGPDAAPVVDNGKPAPLLVADAPADAEAKLEGIAQEKANLLTKFDDGEITAKEYQAAIDKLAKEERAIEFAVHEAQLAAKMQQQQEKNAWLTMAQEFTTKAHPEYSTSKVRYMALDSFVREIGSDPANAHMTGAQILAEAHRRVVEDLGEVQAVKATGNDGRPLKGSKAAPPKTLADVPAAESNTMEDGKWAALDRLAQADPLAFEDRLMKLSDAERDEYLSR